MTNDKNLFATVLTYAAPSSNYRGEGEENRVVLQKIKKGAHDYAVISPESIRSALRDIISQFNKDWCNRSRLHDAGQPAVELKEYHDPEKYADDFLFGFMVADKKAIAANKKKATKRDSVLRINMAVALSDYRYDATFHQSPKVFGKDGATPPYSNTKTGDSVLYHRERTYTAFQYPFALSGNDCKVTKNGVKWTRALLEAIAQLTNVAGGHADGFYQMFPRSIVTRLTSSLVSGYDSYGFDDKGAFQELKRVNYNALQSSNENSREHDLPGNEFWIGGELARNMATDEKLRLTNQGVKFYDNPQKLLGDIADELLKAKA